MAESPLPYDSFHLIHGQIQGFVVPVGSRESKNLPAEVVALDVAWPTLSAALFREVPTFCEVELTWEVTDFLALVASSEADC